MQTKVLPVSFLVPKISLKVSLYHILFAVECKIINAVNQEFVKHVLKQVQKLFKTLVRIVIFILKQSMKTTKTFDV